MNAKTNLNELTRLINKTGYLYVHTSREGYIETNHKQAGMIIIKILPQGDNLITLIFNRLLENWEGYGKLIAIDVVYIDSSEGKKEKHIKLSWPPMVDVDSSTLLKDLIEVVTAVSKVYNLLGKDNERK
jgi:hypothetical protein